MTGSQVMHFTLHSHAVTDPVLTPAMRAHPAHAPEAAGHDGARHDGAGHDGARQSHARTSSILRTMAELRMERQARLGRLERLRRSLEAISAS